MKQSNSPLTDSPFCLDLFFRSRRCLLAFCATLQIPVCTAVGFVRINHLVLLRVSIQRPQWCVFLITLQGGVNQGIPQLFQVSRFHFIPLCCASGGQCWWLRGRSQQVPQLAFTMSGTVGIAGHPSLLCFQVPTWRNEVKLSICNTAVCSGSSFNRLPRIARKKPQNQHKSLKTSSVFRFLQIGFTHTGSVYNWRLRYLIWVECLFFHFSPPHTHTTVWCKTQRLIVSVLCYCGSIPRQ